MLDTFQVEIPKTVNVKFKFNPEIQLDGEMSTYKISDVGKKHHTNNGSIT